MHTSPKGNAWYILPQTGAVYQRYAVLTRTACASPLWGATTLSRGPGGVGRVSERPYLIARTPGRSRPSDQREGPDGPAPTQWRQGAKTPLRRHSRAKRSRLPLPTQAGTHL